MVKVKVREVLREVVVLDAPVKVSTVYRRANTEPKAVEFYCIAYAVVLGQARVLATNDPTDLSDGALSLRYLDGISKLSDRTTIEAWDVEPEAIAAVLDGLYFYPFSPARRQVEHVDESNSAELAEAVHGFGAEPFANIKTDSVTLSLITPV